MRNPNETAVYFKMPQTIKNDFDHICNVDGITKSHILNTFIRGFVEHKTAENKDLYTRPQEKKNLWLVEDVR